VLPARLGTARETRCAPAAAKAMERPMVRSARIKIQGSPPVGMPLSNFMNEVRAWLDSQKIQSNVFRSTTSDVGFGFVIGFEREEDAARFRERFDPQ
jgi:hypothetical protein